MRPVPVCYCAKLRPTHARTHVVFLQHPRERGMAIGTARMAHLSLPGSELHVGLELADHSRVSAVAREPGTYVLFPGDGASSPAQLRDAPPRNLIVVDGTWPMARKVITKNPFLAALPRVGISPRRPSNYRIRRQPAAHCISTIEAVAEVLGALEGDHARFDAMLEAFDYMVDLQLDRARRHGAGRLVGGYEP